jgi:hypothetical protein
VIANVSEHTLFPVLYRPRRYRRAHTSGQARMMGRVRWWSISGWTKRGNSHLPSMSPHLRQHGYKGALPAFVPRPTLAQATACLNRVLPDCSPREPASFPLHNEPRDRRADVTPEKYHEEKERIAGRSLRNSKVATGIDLLPHIEEIEIATRQPLPTYRK